MAIVLDYNITLHTIMSSTGRGTKRIDKDNYPTPLYSLTPMIERINFTNVQSFLEPCKGDGRILNLIPDNVRSKLWCEIREGSDYLKAPLFNIDLIVTNPPFSISIPFLEKSLQEAKTVCYLQRINWLGSDKRKDFWNTHTPDKLFVLSKRPAFIKEYLKLLSPEEAAEYLESKKSKSSTDSSEYAWFIWDKLDIVRGKHIEVL